MKKVKEKKIKPLFSAAHKKYVREQYTKTFLVHFFRILILVAFLGLWELSAHFGWLDPFITSSPSRIIAQLSELYTSGSLWNHIWVTL